MSSSSSVRSLAFQLLFQLDASGGGDPAELAAQMEHGQAAREVRKACELASAAYADRQASDAATAELAPGWPAHRQPAIDRAILRLAHHEISKDPGSGAIIINDAVNLAKEFGTEKSPGFVNALLDKILKAKLSPTPATPPSDPPPSSV